MSGCSSWSLEVKKQPWDFFGVSQSQHSWIMGFSMLTCGAEKKKKKEENNSGYNSMVLTRGKLTPQSVRL